MFTLEHHVRVFVFQVLEREIQYLLLRHKPVVEWPLGPVVGAVGTAEHMRDAVVREVREDTGIRTPHHVIDLAPPSKELFGDIGLVEWSFAYQAGTPTSPSGALAPAPDVGEIVWMSFEEAFRRVESAQDRDILVRLQLHLHQN